MAGALILAGLAVHAFRSEGALLDRLLFTLGAVGLFLWGAWRDESLATPHGTLPEELPLDRKQWVVLGVGLLLGALAWTTFDENRLSPAGLLLLGGAIAMVGWAAWQRKAGQEAAGPKDLLDPRVRRLALIAIVLLGAAFRLYRLDTLPSDMFNDLAHIHQETSTVMRGEWMIYGTVYPGREPLLFYLNAFLAQAIGLSFFSLKLCTALIGILTVPLIYLVGREAYNDAVGLVAALFLAVAKWHVLISRVGFRGILTPFVTALVLYFMLRGLRRGRRADLLWAGAWTGAGLYTYTAALAVIPAVVLGLGAYALAGRGTDLWRVRRSLLLAALIALLVALPMLRYMLGEQGRQQFWFRPQSRVSDAERPLPGSLGQILLGNLSRTAGMFHVQGDVVFRTNIPYDPHLDVLAGALFLLGLALVGVRWRRGGNGLLVVFFVVLLLPTALALAFPDEVPGAVRSSGAMATVMLFPAVAVVMAWRKWGRMVPALRSSWGWGVLLAGLALWGGLLNGRLCFVEYSQYLPAGNYPLYREIARVIDDLADEGPVYLKSIPHWDDRDAIRLQTRDHHDWGLYGEILTEIDPVFLQGLPSVQAAVILQPERDAASLETLRQLFPQGMTLTSYDHQGQAQFAVFLFRPENPPTHGEEP